MRALSDRVASLDHRRVDAMFAVAIIIELQFEVWLERGIPDSHRLLTAAAVVFYAAPVAFRRQWPAVALVSCAAVALIQALLGGNLSDPVGILVPPTVLAYSAGAWLAWRRGLVALVLGAGVLGAFTFLSDPKPRSFGDAVGQLFLVSLLVPAPWFLGRVERERSRRAAAFRELAAQAAAEHDERGRAAIAQERVRIGHELQDIIAHSVSAMVIQAGAARWLLRSDPERARASILAVEHTGREALADLRRLLGMLRKGDDPRALAPQPGLDQLATLLGTMHNAGLACELRKEGEPIGLTPGIDLVGYRVIEAALAYAAHHQGSRVVVTVRYRPERLELEIRGDGAMADLDEELRGMCQRVALYDGILRTMPAGGVGFALQARLPLTAAVPA
jgi:signal transduction histidine kinase